MTRGRRTPREDPRAITDLVRRLGGLLNELGLSEIEVSTGETRVRLTRTPAGFTTAGVTAAPPPAQVADALSVTGVTIEAPMVGTFYRASSPSADPYVREGDVVKEGQIVCIIEAMKLMNEVETRAGGRIMKILVDNGQAVEYGQPLFLIDPMR